MKNALVGLAVALGALSFSSCSLEPYVITAEEQYMRDFIKKFGLVDAEQDWNMAKSEDIKVNVGAGSKHLKLYAKVGNTYYLIADYYNVEGTITIPVDVPEGTRDILAISDGSRYYGTVGSTLDCTGAGSRADSRADNFPAKEEITILDNYKYTNGKDIPDGGGKYYYSISTETTINGFTVTSGYLTDETDPRAFEYFNAQQIAPITSNRIWRDYYSLNGNTIRENNYTVNDGFGLIPENGLKETPIGNVENPGIFQNFTITAKDGNFIIYPMYWDTSQFHELGVYLYDENEEEPLKNGDDIALFPIFLDKRNDNGHADLYVYKKEQTLSYHEDIVELEGDEAFASIPSALLSLRKIVSHLKMGTMTVIHMK